MPSLTYPAVVIETNKGCSLEPKDDLITSYIFSPASPCQELISSAIQHEILKPSLRLDENAKAEALLLDSAT